MAKKQQWNEGPSFSWANVTLVLAILVIAIATYMHGFYKTGNYMDAFSAASIVPPIPDLVFALVLMALFIVVQFLKGTSRHFAKRIRWEWALLLISIPVFLLSLKPVNYTLSVLEHGKSIEEAFGRGVTAFRGLFDDYDQYCNDRMASLEKSLDSQGIRGYSKENYLLTLKLQLQNDTEEFPKYKAFREEAEKWIEEKGTNPSVWNPFIVANTDTIQDKLEKWVNQLESFSAHRLEKEQGYPTFINKSDVLPSVKEAFQEVKTGVRHRSGLSPHILWVGLLLYAMLLLPYLLQERHTKARGRYSLLGPMRSSASEIEQREEPKEVAQAQPDNSTHEEETGCSSQEPPARDDDTYFEI